MQLSFEDALLDQRILELQGIRSLQLQAVPAVPVVSAEVLSACEWCDHEFVRIRTGSWEADAFCSNRCREQHLR